MNKHIDISIMDNCQNPAESYGEICVGCNKCGRFDEEKQINEMARAMCFYKEQCNVNSCVQVNCETTWLAEALYKADYRKQSDIVANIIDEFKDLTKNKLLDQGLYLVAFKNATVYAETELKKKYAKEN